MGNHFATVPPGNKQDKSKLNPRQKAFVDTYIQTGNLAESVRKAGYESKNPTAYGLELLKNQKIQAAIHARTAELENERTATTQEVLEYLASVLRGETTDEVVINVGKGKGYTQPEKVKAKVTNKDRLKAAELLGKVKGIFITKAEVDLQGVLPVVIRDDV